MKTFKLSFGSGTKKEFNSIDAKTYYEKVLKTSGNANVPATFQEWEASSTGQKWQNTASLFAASRKAYVLGNIETEAYNQAEFARISNARNQQAWKYGEDNSDIAGTFVKIENTEDIQVTWENPNDKSVLAAANVRGAAIFGGSIVGGRMNLNMPAAARETGIDAMASAKLYFTDTEVCRIAGKKGIGKSAFGYFAAGGTAIPVMDANGNINKEVFIITTGSVFEHNRTLLTRSQIKSGGVTQSFEDFDKMLEEKEELHNVGAKAQQVKEKRATVLLRKSAELLDKKTDEEIAEIDKMDDYDTFMSQFGDELAEFTAAFANVDETTDA